MLKRIEKKRLLNKADEVFDKYISLKQEIDNHIKNTKPKIAYITADWKDTEGLIYALRKAMKKHKLYMYQIPCFQGSDEYGFMISDKKLTKKQIKDETTINS